MAHPTTKVEIAFDSGPTEFYPTWTDVSAYVAKATVSRGRSSDLDKFGQSHATVVLNNADRRFDPLNLSGPYVVPARLESYNLLANATFGGTNNWTTTGTYQVGYQNLNVFGLGTGVATSTYSDPFPVTGNLVYTASISLRCTNYQGQTARIQLEFRTGAGAWTSYNGPTITLTSSYQRTSITQTAPAGSTEGRLVVFFNAIAAGVQVDLTQPMVEQSATLNNWWIYDTENNVFYVEYVYVNGYGMYHKPYRAAYTKLKPRQQIRITADANNGTGYKPVFRGFISGYPVQYSEAGKTATTVLDCFDLFGLLATTEIQPDWAYIIANPLYRGADVEGSTTLTDVYGSANVTQISGTTGFTTLDALAPNLPNRAVNIGKDNVWKSPSSTNWVFSSLGFVEMWGWWAKGTPSVDTTPFVVGNKANALELTVLASGQMRVRWYTGSNYTQWFSAASTYNSFVPHHVFVSAWSGKLYIDGVDVTTNTSVVAGANPYTSDGGQWVRFADDVFQDFGWSDPLGGSSITAYDIQQWYGVGVDKLPENTSARFQRIMQRTGLAANWYTFLSSAETTVSAIGMGGPVSPQLDILTDSEGGHLFVNKSGVLTMTQRSYAAANASGTVKASFTTDTSGLRFGKTIAVDTTADEILNDVQINYSGGGGVTASNATSKTNYGKRATSIDTQIGSTTDATSLATFMATVYGTPKTQISAFEVSVANTAAHWDTILGLELLDAISLQLTPPVGTSITKVLTIQSIEHEITSKTWRTMLRGSERYSGWFVLDKSSLDGTDIML